MAAVLFDGVVYSSWLFLMAAGLTLIYGVMRILNIAHGSLYALGAYTGATLGGAWIAAGYAPVGSFAMLAAACIDRVPANLPQVTGAKRRVVLGQVA